MPLRHEIVSSIVVKTKRYPYKLNKDGTRNINKEFSKDEDFEFKFGLAELAMIIFRDSPNKLNIDNKEMYFDYSNGKLLGIHFEDDDYIWMVNDYTDIMDECKRLFAIQYVMIDTMNRMAGQQIGTSNLNLEEYLDDDDIPDEFDVGGEIEDY